MFYAGQKQLRVRSDCAEILGIPLEMYIPEEKVAIETFYAQEKSKRHYAAYIYLLLQMNVRIQNLSAKGFMNGEGGRQNERT